MLVGSINVPYKFLPKEYYQHAVLSRLLISLLKLEVRNKKFGDKNPNIRAFRRTKNMSPHKLMETNEVQPAKGRHWIMGAEAFERRMPHHDGIKALWETKWKFPCTKSLYPFHDGKYEDFEPIFTHLIANDINDGTSPEYTRAFFPIAEALVARADAATAGSAEATELYLRACAVYRIARFPYITAYPRVNCPVKWEAWEAQKAAYLRCGRAWAEPVQEAMVAHTHRKGNDRDSIPVYVRVPKTTAESGGPCPAVILMTGLDGYRPDNTVRCDEFLARGWGVVVVEIPGTADCPADSADPESPDRLWSSVLDWMAALEMFDMRRILVWGLSSGGYYAIRIAHTHKDRLVGSIAQGAGCHYFYDREWLEKADGHEYPFKLTPAMAMKHGYESVEEYKEGVQKKFSLLETGIINMPSTRLLLVNGTLDGLMPIEDSMMLFEYGSPKEARFFTDALHMGYPLANGAVYPWMESTLLCGLLRRHLAILVIKDLADLDRPQMVNPSTELAVVVEQIPLALELDDGVVRRPAQDWLEDPPAIGKRTVGRVADGVAQVVGVAGRVGKVVLAVVLVHPGGLEEAPVVVVGQDALARLGRQDFDLAHLLVELPHVARQPGHLWAQGVDALAGGFVGPLERGVEHVVALLVALQLATPQAAKVDVRLLLGVVVDEDGRVDAEGALDGLRVRGKGPLGLVGDGDADAEYPLLVAGGEVEVVLAVAGGGVGGPQLFGHPGDVLGAEGQAVVHDGLGRVEAVGGEDVVVGHVVLVAVVVELDVGLAVVRRVDVDLVVEDVGRRVGRVEVGYQGGHVCDCVVVVLLLFMLGFVEMANLWF
ncbi:hypothetical protein PspLS_08025 [Pyricularia sp. CBS 133598]|nr:hypothetical protein PspLS_08025 [Pyricularia sp. CBS 133598]